MLSPFVHDRMRTALEGTPTVLTTLLASFTADDPRWDRRPDPERFTLREVLAHLADYEDIWFRFLQRAFNESTLPLPAYRADELAVFNDYPNTVPGERLDRFRAGRASFVALLTATPSEKWNLQTVDHPRLGDCWTIEGLAGCVLAHDGYHTRQVAEYVGSNL